MSDSKLGVHVRPYEDDDFDDEGFVLSCTWCSGEGEFFGNDPYCAECQSAKVAREALRG